MNKRHGSDPWPYSQELPARRADLAFAVPSLDQAHAATQQTKKKSSVDLSKAREPMRKVPVSFRYRYKYNTLHSSLGRSQGMI